MKSAIFLLFCSPSLLGQPSCSAPEGCCSFLGEMFPPEHQVVAVLDGRNNCSMITLFCIPGPTIIADLYNSCSKPLGKIETYSISHTKNETTTTTPVPITTKSPSYKQNITTPNYPENYDSNTHKNWSLAVAAGQRLKLTFLDFIIERNPQNGHCYDWVELRYEGFQGQKFCGPENPGSFVSSTNTMDVSFHSDKTVNFKGFLAEFEAVSNNSEECTCGLENNKDPSKIQTRILHGNETQKNQYPWMVGLEITRLDGIYVCGGTLISSKYVLTAAHCVTNVEDQNRKPVKVIFGDHDKKFGENLEKIINVKQIIKHHSYNDFTLENDIALLELAEEVDLSVYTPACLPKFGENFVGKTAMATGWGQTENGKGSDVLLRVYLQVSDDQMAGFISAYGGAEGYGTCMGDSGGPLTYQEGNQHTLIGVTSNGETDETDDFCTGELSRFTSVSYYMDWIEEEMKVSKFCKTDI